MTRYILKPVVNMHDCNLCSKEFKNSRSLASHKYKFHDRANLKRSFDDGSGDEMHPTKTTKVDKQNSGSRRAKYQSNESSNEDSPSESSSETEEMFKEHTATRNKDDIMNSIKPTQRSKPIIPGYKSQKYETDTSEESDQESILGDVYHKKSRHRENRSDMNIKDLAPNKYEINKRSRSRSNGDLKQHTKLIKTVCKCILDGRIPLKPPHITKLKPHRKFIRNVAHGNIKEAKKHIQTGGSILQTVLKTVLPILSELLL